MNKDYTYIDGKAIIRDENDNQVLTDYYDNIGEVLAQENVVENIEERIKIIEDKIKFIENWNTKNIKKKYYFILLCTILIIVFGVPAIFYLFGNIGVYTNIIKTSFGPMNEALMYIAIFSAFFVTSVSIAELSFCKIYKNILKERDGLNIELEFLKKQIVKEREKLNLLSREKVSSKKDYSFKSFTVNDTEKMQELDKSSNLYFDLGFNMDKYYGYYRKGKLSAKLRKSYDANRIEAANEYFERNKHILARKRTYK